MSDDIALVFAEDLARPAATERRVGFLSAMSQPQMQQYAAAGWKVFSGPAFESAATIDLAEVPSTKVTDGELHNLDLISLEAPTWPKDVAVKLKQWLPRTIKVNGAFHGTTDPQGERIAGDLIGLGYDLIGCHWRDDNSYALRSLSRIDRLVAFGAPDWKRLNLIAVRDPELVQTLLTLARLYVGEERRIAELRVSHAVRGDHIARLEDAIMTHQRPRN